MKPMKDFVYKDYLHARRVDTTDEDIVSGVIAMIALGSILGLMMGLAI
jgi:hypothetical protein